MDIKLRSNDNKVLSKEDSKYVYKPNIVNVIIFGLTIILIATTLFSKITSNRYKGGSLIFERYEQATYDDYYDPVNDAAWLIGGDLAFINNPMGRYAKNLQRFFVYFKGFSPNNYNVTDEDMNAMLDELIIMQLEDERVIEEKYQKMIYDIYNSNDFEIKFDAEMDYSQDINDYYNGNVYEQLNVWNTENGETGTMFYPETAPEIESINAPNEATADYFVVPEDSAEILDANETIDVFEEYTTTSSVAIGDIISKSYDGAPQSSAGTLQSLVSEKEAALDEVKKIYKNLRSDLVGQINEEKIQNYNEVQSYLLSNKLFNYYLEDAVSGNIYTNIPEGYLPISSFIEDKSKHDIYTSLDSPWLYEIDFNGKTLGNSFEEANLTGYIFLTPYAVSPRSEDGIAENITWLRFHYGMNFMFNNIFIVSLCASIIFLLYSLIFARKTTVFCMSRLYHYYKKLPLTLKLGLTILFPMLSYSVDPSWKYNYNNFYARGFVSENVMSYVLCIILLSVFVLVLLLGIIFAVAKLRNIKSLKEEFEIKLVLNAIRDVLFIFKQRIFWLSFSVLILVLSYAIMQILIILAALYSEMLLFLFFEPLLIIFVIFSFEPFLALAKVNYFTGQMILGNTLEVDEKRGMYKTILNKMDNLNRGVKTARVEKHKSDQLKAELITNVSHDLKTPLTSIINYVELLKNSNASEEEKIKYLDVIEQKGQRLKILIEDLFEATKLSSGQIQLETQNLNIVSLVNQALGELSEQIANSDIAFKFTTSSPQILLDLDGRKMWRVFENLIINIIKYAQKGTRAYISIEESDTEVTMSFKNISYYEMNFDSSEIFERFKRGDESRSSEGSGLGLSIGKDIVELHNGTMDIIIDGDLFKVVITLYK